MVMLDTILQCDVRSCLKQLEDGSVQCVITSPPYWGLRDYGTATWEGGDPNCDHLVGRFTTPVSDKQASSVGSGTMQAAGVCPKCGARRIDSQIGLEPTPEAYVADLVEVFREVKRVLRNDGVLWLNLGDSYANTSASGQNNFEKSTLSGGRGQRDPMNPGLHKRIPDGIKSKDLVGIPWMVAFALRADGWYLRSDIIWNKPNPMPESVTDRCTKSHEYIFMLTKSERYYYDAEAIKEPVSEVSLKRAEYGWDCDRESTKNASMGGEGIHVEKMGTRFVNPDGRNKRDVWTVATQPCAEAHFATFPPKLIEPMILAGTKEGDTILDPFMGSGTTAIQAVRWHRHYLGCELNPEYVKMAERRIADMVGPLFGAVES
jgi:DNA modification methylase